MVMKSKSFNAVFCVPRLKLSINGLFAALSMGGLLIPRLSPPRRLPAPSTCKHPVVGEGGRDVSAWEKSYLGGMRAVYPPWLRLMWGHPKGSLMNLLGSGAIPFATRRSGGAVTGRSRSWTAESSDARCGASRGKEHLS